MSQAAWPSNDNCNRNVEYGRRDHSRRSGVHNGDSRKSALKIEAGSASNVSFAIANATTDANAALTLQLQIAHNLSEGNPATHSEARSIIVGTMTEWVQPFYQPPSVQFLVGIVCSSISPEDGGPGLYFCEPPNTILRIQTSDSSFGYRAWHGGGYNGPSVYNFVCRFLRFC